MLTKLSDGELALARAREALGETRDVQRRRLAVLRDWAAGWVEVSATGPYDFNALHAAGLMSSAEGVTGLTDLGRALLAQDGGT